MRLTWTAAVFLAAGCGTIEGPGHASDADADTDADSDGDGDTDSSTGSSTGSDTATGTGTDSDTASETASETVTDTATGTDAFWSPCDFDFGAFDCDSVAGDGSCHDVALCVWESAGDGDVAACLLGTTPAHCVDVIALAECACDRCPEECESLGSGKCATCACGACVGAAGSCLGPC